MFGRMDNLGEQGNSMLRGNVTTDKKAGNHLATPRRVWQSVFVKGASRPDVTVQKWAKLLHLPRSSTNMEGQPRPYPRRLPSGSTTTTANPSCPVRSSMERSKGQVVPRQLGGWWDRKAGDQQASDLQNSRSVSANPVANQQRLVGRGLSISRCPRDLAFEAVHYKQH